MSIAISYTIEIISVAMVENFNPKQESIIGMQQAIDNLMIKPDIILTDITKQLLKEIVFQNQLRQLQF
ncbi:hypothetical protein [Spiroplasma kunkelii]|uniref:hypothetical protein n=1 Tax=Spiroplasma kunkelii TaxID=47834 RepID=UPI000323CCA0|nr:hypothetical protein [Spiroplasma kunkelii]